jgi:aldehyde dehydrogenase
MSSAIDDRLIRDVVSEVLARLGSNNGATLVSAAAPAPSAPPRPAPPVSAAGDWGVFPDVSSAVRAAQAAQQQLLTKTLDERNDAIQCIRDVVVNQAEELGRIEFEETKIGRLDHKIEKLVVVGKKVPGMEMITTEAVSGDHGLCVTEHAPYGVIGVITPVTHSVPTLACNAIMILAGGNTLVCNPHPSGAKVACEATQRWNRAIYEKIGIRNLICIIGKPTLETAKEVFTHPDIAMLCVTGGPGVASAAMRSNKKAAVAGPGNPPVVVDETADIEKAAAGIIFGAAYDNNLLCIGEKECFVVQSVADALLSAMSRHGAFQLNREQADALAEIAIHKDEKSGHWVANKEFVGKDPQVLGAAIGVTVPPGTQLLYGEVDPSSPWLPCEQMMPFLPIVRVPNVDEGIRLAVHFEHGFGHTAIIWSQSVDNMTKMGKAVDTTLFIKNGACMTGLGLGGEGFVSYSIATPTGEGPTSPLTFTRVRRCVMVDNLRIL